MLFWKGYFLHPLQPFCFIPVTLLIEEKRLFCVPLLAQLLDGHN